MSGHGKRYTSARSQIDRERAYSPLEAIKMLKGFAEAKFDGSVSTFAMPISSCAAR
jgi:ribosomal protein L1